MQLYIINSSVNIKSEISLLGWADLGFEITNQITKDLSEGIFNQMEVVKSYLAAGFRLPNRLCGHLKLM